MFRVILFSFLLYGTVITICSAYKQTFTFFESADNTTGNFLTVVNKMHDISNYSAIIEAHAYVCVNGLWSFYENQNYTGRVFVYMVGAGYCGTPYPYLRFYGSARFAGPSDYNTEAIGFYDGTTYTGKEFLVTDVQAPTLPFHPISLLMTGPTRVWTVFEDVNYNGPSACMFGGVYSLNYTSLGINTIRSVREGCDGNSVVIQKNEEFNLIGEVIKN